ncbi:MAG: clan AA aspartic protease [Bacteroidetes bacterium]|jgi:predicted aspartyl protease|nr:clan AA aspartic protease [Bacteroidota bacterium]
MKKKVTVPIQVVHLGEEGTHIFCKAKVNGVKARVLIDTGASKTVLSKSFALTLKGLKEVSVSDNSTSGIGPESVEATFVRLRSLRFKSLKIKKLVVGTIDVSHVDAMYDTLNVKPFDMILGGEVLESYNVVIDYKKQQLVFN